MRTRETETGGRRILTRFSTSYPPKSYSMWRPSLQRKKERHLNLTPTHSLPVVLVGNHLSGNTNAQPKPQQQLKPQQQFNPQQLQFHH